jgi:cell division protein FtsW (lipid II flippase)
MSAISKMVNALLFVTILILAAGVAFYAQAASPDYTRLFITVAPFVALLLALVALYARRVRTWTRWIAVGSFLMAAVSFSELGLRLLK